jgi:two-component system, cell cycle sensor histidine kinase and response regulator CckA
MQGEPVIEDSNVVAAAVSAQETSELRTTLGDLVEEHRVLLEHLPDGLVTVVDADLRYTQVNRTMEGLGWVPEDVVGRTVDDVFDDRPEICALYRAALAGESQSLDYASLTGERRFWLQLVPLRRGAEIFGVMSIAQDVTGRAETKRQLREATEEFESAFHYSGIGMALIDLDGRWLKVNKSVCELVGYDEDELLALRFQDITHPSDLDADLAEVARVLAGEIDSYQMEKRYIRKDGSIVPVLLTVSVVRDEQGAAVRFVSQIQDRTSDVHRRELEAELAERRRADSLSVLAGGVAHDFNNLLVGILGHTSMALGETPEGSPVRRHLEQVESSARAVAAVTEQMLAFSGKAWRELTDVDLGEHARELYERFSGSVNGVTVHLSPSPELPAVRADVAQLNRITANLVDNAMEALGATGGTISISTGALHVTRMALDAYSIGIDAEPGRFAYLDIADDGEGMSEDVRGRMFEPFFTTKFQGRGLGLAAVDGLVRGHGGAIAVQSAPGSGTRVRLLLPAAA